MNNDAGWRIISSLLVDLPPCLDLLAAYVAYKILSYLIPYLIYLSYLPTYRTGIPPTDNKIPLDPSSQPQSLPAMRTSPNVIITGTPGVGKTVHCEQLAQDTGLRHLSINQVAKDRDCFESYDNELGSWVIDEDKVLADTL